MKNKRLKPKPRQPFQPTLMGQILGSVAFFGLVFTASSVVYLVAEIVAPVIGCLLRHIHSYVLELFSFDCQCK